MKAPWLSPGQRTATRYDDLRFYQQAGCPPGARTFHDLANEVMRTVTATPHRWDAIDGLIDYTHQQQYDCVIMRGNGGVDDGFDQIVLKRRRPVRWCPADCHDTTGPHVVAIFVSAGAVATTCSEQREVPLVARRARVCARVCARV